jgi:23S rRNA-/tRNA-specific pseudouridylate synthase
MGVTLLLVEFPEIIFENSDYLALNKPAGWFTIPAREPSPKDLVLTEWIKNTHGTEAWTIHRLDRYTSGIILFAKNIHSQKEGNTWFQNREIKKTYQFLAAPPPRMPAIQVREPIEGKPSQTLFEVIQKNETVFFGKATPLTGRFHQVRAHAAHAGFPILGDEKFGGKTSLMMGDSVVSFTRFCLHAFELQLPFGTFQATLAKDLVELKGKLFP